MSDFPWNDQDLLWEIQVAIEVLGKKQASTQRPSARPAPLSDLDQELALLTKFLSREDYAWFWVRDPRAARRRWWWACLRFLRFCSRMAREQRRISRGRTWHQSTDLGTLIWTEVTVHAGIAALAGLGMMHFTGLRYDRGEIAARFQLLYRQIHPHAPVIVMPGG